MAILLSIALLSSPQRRPKSLRGSLLIVNASSAGDACLHVQIAVPTVSMLHQNQVLTSRHPPYPQLRQSEGPPLSWWYEGQM